MRPHRIALLAAAMVFMVAATLVAFTVLMDTRSTNGVQQGSGVADIGGPFTLTDETGKHVTEADLLGKPSVIFFGFTFCPDVCPTTLYELSGLIRELGPDAERMNFVFISVDWERDGPAKLADYLSSFDERIRGFSGTKEQIEAVTKAYKVYYERVPAKEGDYTINHTASVLLMDKDGRFVGTIGYGEGPDTARAKLKRLADSAWRRPEET